MKLLFFREKNKIIAQVAISRLGFMLYALGFSC